MKKIAQASFARDSFLDDDEDDDDSKIFNKRPKTSGKKRSYDDDDDNDYDSNKSLDTSVILED